MFIILFTFHFFNLFFDMKALELKRIDDWKELEILISGSAKLVVGRFGTTNKDENFTVKFLGLEDQSFYLEKKIFTNKCEVK